MGFEAFTKAFNSAYKSTSERKSMFDEDDKKSSSHWEATTTEDSTAATPEVDAYATFITGGADELLATTGTPSLSTYDQNNELDHQLLKDNNIQAFDVGEHGKENSFLSKIWKGTFGNGETYDTSNDYYSAHLTKIKDQKGLDLVNEAKRRNIPIPEDSIYDSSTYSSDSYKLLETALENDREMNGDPDSTENQNLRAKEERIKNATEWQLKQKAERKVEADKKAESDKQHAIAQANAKRIKAARVDRNAIAAYNEYGDNEAGAPNKFGQRDGYNPDDFDNSADAKAYYENESVDSGQVGSSWKNKLQNFLPGGKTGTTSITPYQADLNKHSSMMNQKGMLEQAMRNASNNGSDETDSEWENQVDPVGMSQFSEQIEDPGFPNYDEGPNMWDSPDPQYTDRELYEKSLASKKAMQAWHNRKRVGNR